MATHAEVAARLVRHINPKDPANPPAMRALQGSNFYADPVPAVVSAGVLDTWKAFALDTVAISYRTEIAYVVTNTFTSKPELWVTPRRYSPTTDRHMSHVRSAFLTKAMAPEIYGSYEEAIKHIFTYMPTFGINTMTARFNVTTQCNSAYVDARHYMKQAVRAGIHMPTRRNYIRDAWYAIANVLRNLIQDVPVDIHTHWTSGNVPAEFPALYREAVANLRDDFETLEQLVTADDKTMRAQAEALVAIDHFDNKYQHV